MSEGYWAYRVYRLAPALPCPPRVQVPRLANKLRPTCPTLRDPGPGGGRDGHEGRAVRHPLPPLHEHHAALLADLLQACTRQAESGHEKTRPLARELLNDWDTFWVVLDYLPPCQDRCRLPLGAFV